MQIKLKMKIFKKNNKLLKLDQIIHKTYNQQRKKINKIKLCNFNWILIIKEN